MKAMFLVGPHASGKTYSAKLALQNGSLDDVLLIDTGPMIRKIHASLAPEMKLSEWVEKIEEEHGDNITDDLIIREIELELLKQKKDKCLIIGFRTLDGINYLMNHMEVDDYKVLYIDADINLLYQNYQRREKEIPYDKFLDYILEEYHSGLEELKQECMTNENFEYVFKTDNSFTLDEHINKFFNPSLSLIRKVGDNNE